MKIAIAGKGGTGKTTITTLLATYFAQFSYVLAVDSDSNENLAYALGFEQKKLKTMRKIRHFTNRILAYTKTDANWETRHVTPVPDAGYFSFRNGVLNSFLDQVLLTKNRISVAHLGTVDEDKRGIQSMCGAYSLMRIFLNHLQEDEKDYVLVDLPAGNELLTRAAVINMDCIFLVVEPTVKNLTVAKDILLSLEKLFIDIDDIYVLINKSFKTSDITYVTKELSIAKEHIRRIPFSSRLIEIDNQGKLSFETAPDELKKPIEELVTLIHKKTTHETKFLERAQAIDRRLFPHEHAVLTEEIHI